MEASRFDSAPGDRFRHRALRCRLCIPAPVGRTMVTPTKREWYPCEAAYAAYSAYVISALPFNSLM